MPDISVTDTNRQQLDKAPPQPPRQGRSMMAMASDGKGGADSVNMSNPAVQAMSIMGDIRQGMMKLSVLLPGLAMGLQQMMTGLEQVVPQQVADMVAGNPPGSGGSGLGAPQANAAPTAPPVQAGMT